ncbi:MAG TPA: hypothetical protein VH593_14800, partial [Ktedonobacteraceae bacterium]
AIWHFVRRANQYIEQSEPWHLAKQPEQAERLDTVLYSAAEATRILAILLFPFVPESCDKIMAQLGLAPVQSGDWVSATAWGAHPLQRVIPGNVLFPRLDASSLVEV